MKSSPSILFAVVLVVNSWSCSGDSAGPEEQPTVPAAVTGKGVPVGTPTQATIGPAGGQLSSSDGRIGLTVPAGALATATVIGIQPMTNLAPGGSGHAFQLTPEGTTFAALVQLTFRITDEELAGSTLALARVAYQDAEGHWLAIKAVTRDLANREVSVSTTHFSTWAQTFGLKLSPPSATVQAGGSVPLVIEDCKSPTAASGDELVSLLPSCQPAQEFGVWRANGIVNGNAVNGFVLRETNNSATYEAPRVAPAANPVRVEAEVSVGHYGTTTTYSTELLFSNITVSDQPAWTGNISSVLQLAIGGFSSTTITTSASITWTWNPADERYQPLGTLVYNFNHTNSAYSPPCHETAHASVPIGAQDGFLYVEAGAYQAAGTNNAVTVTQTGDCNDLRVVTSTTNTGPLNWWPPTQGVLSANGKLMAGTSSNGTLRWTWSFTRP